MAVFKEYLRQIWLGQYNRGGGYQSSSGFEHIFLGEKDNTTIQGYHSWFKYYRDEQAGKINYLGYLRNINLGVVCIHLLVYTPFFIVLMFYFLDFRAPSLVCL